MKRPAVFFDRDNTLIVSDGYLGDPAKVVLVRGAAQAVARARNLGYAVVCFSNQSGVARGMFSEEDVHAVNARTDELLAAEDAAAVIDRHEFCPFHPDGTIDIYARESDRRKPGPGMIHSAAKMLALDLERSWVIGDAARDVEAGKAAGCRAILFDDATLDKSPAAKKPPAVDPDYIVSTLGEAVDYIEQNPDPAAVPVAAKHVAAVTETNEMPPPAPSVAPMSYVPAPEPERRPEPATEPEPAPAAVAVAIAEPEPDPTPAPRVPKVVIGSKYVPPVGRDVSPPRAAAVAARAATVDDETPAPPRAKASSRNNNDDNRPPEPPPTLSERTETLLEQIFLELRRQHEHHESDFSVSKLLAGIAQMLALAVLVLSYFKQDASPTGHQTYLQVALVLQTMTIALLIMSRQK